MRLSHALASLIRRKPDTPAPTPPARSRARSPEAEHPPDTAATTGAIRAAPTIASEPTQPRPRGDSRKHYLVPLALPPLEMAKAHARDLYEWLRDPDQFTPGSAVAADHMRDLYAARCAERKWLVRPWQPVAAELNRLMGGKFYRASIDTAGRERKVRVYIVPDRRPEAPQAKPPPTKPRPKRRRADSDPVRVRVAA